MNAFLILAVIGGGMTSTPMDSMDACVKAAQAVVQKVPEDRRPMVNQVLCVGADGTVNLPDWSLKGR